MKIDRLTTDRCIKQAEMIIQYYSNVKGIIDQDREDFRSQGLLGMSVALDRLRSNKASLNGAATTYCNSYVKGYLKTHYHNLYEKRPGLYRGIPTWSHVHQPVSLDSRDPNTDMWLSYNGLEELVAAKDFLSKTMSMLTEKQYISVSQMYFEGLTPTESAQKNGWPRRSDRGSHIIWAFKKMRKYE